MTMRLGKSGVYLAVLLSAAAALAADAKRPAAKAVADIPAFPGAQGFGAFASGGRGGSVYEVTNLDDEGRGSLRDAVNRGDRIVVFRVGGTIRLKSPLNFNASNITIAGQTAPGGGICVRDYVTTLRASNVVVRHLRFRLGDETKQQSDGLTVGHGVRNAVIDHCSISWSVDEALSLAGNVADVSVQWCMIYEALNESLHTKGAHGFGSLSRAVGGVTWHHNLWAHNNARNPRLGDNYGKDPHPQFDVRNNVIYDYGGTCTGLTQGVFTANYVANFIRPGPSSKARKPISVGPKKSDLQFYIADNVVDGDENLTSQNRLFFSQTEEAGRPVVRIADAPFPAPPVRQTSARRTYEDVLTTGGASLPKRDAADERLVKNVRERSGKIINSQAEVGGWPSLDAGEAPADSDHDGMPDAWEKRFDLNPTDAADGALDADGDGYTNIEECLNDTDPGQFVDYKDPKNNVDSLTPPKQP
jgi:pectate lyase